MFLLTEERPIALALSGGGVRAMAFHIGVLRCLAEHRRLEQVKTVSTVSGGSLLVGLLYHFNGLTWPSSAQFIASVLPSLKATLCGKNLQASAIKQLLFPCNWRYAISRANLIAVALREDYGITSRLSDLPATPEWSINGTTAETGKRFRFKRDTMGDYLLGYAEPGSFELATAMAVSAAFPGGIGPLYIKSAEYSWRKRPEWDAPEPDVVQLEFGGLHLYDGGVYDNLGLEPFFDAGTGRSKVGDAFLLVSDAGAPLKKGFSYMELNPFRLKRMADIMSDQARALRVRALMNYLRQGKNRGHYAYIGQHVGDSRESVEQKEFAQNFPTTLRRLSNSEFDSIEGHGYGVTSALVSDAD
jgi:NTE family protein